MKKRLLSVNICNNGSTGKIMRGIGECAEKSGYEVWYATAYDYFRDKSVKYPGNNITIGSFFGRYFHVFAGRYTGMSECFSVLPTFFFLRKVKK